MQKRPTLSEDSFLAHLFSPKKNPLPTGLRARPIAQAKGRRVARVNAYNKMPALKQEVLKRTGLRDAFLKGDVTYTDAKKWLRDTAVHKGIVKPTRVRQPKPNRRISRREAIEGLYAQHILHQLRQAGKTHNPATVYAGTIFMEEDDIESLTYAQIKDRAADPDYIMTRNGHTFNPYWYR
jgi:hypothetical protein